jgi:hypothetical protein
MRFNPAVRHIDFGQFPALDRAFTRGCCAHNSGVQPSNGAGAPWAYILASSHTAQTPGVVLRDPKGWRRRYSGPITIIGVGLCCECARRAA